MSVKMLLQRLHVVPTPLAVLEEVIRFGHFRIPLIRASMLSQQGQVGTTTIVSSSKGLDRRGKLRTASSSLQHTVHFLVVILEERTIMREARSHLGVNGTMLNGVWCIASESRSSVWDLGDLTNHVSQGGITDSNLLLNVDFK